jgi:hypothetical protein
MGSGTGANKNGVTGLGLVLGQVPTQAIGKCNISLDLYLDGVASIHSPVPRNHRFHGINQKFKVVQVEVIAVLIKELKPQIGGCGWS